MKYADIAQQTRENNYFRKVLMTNEHSQVVLMSIAVGDDIGMETHPENDQILYFVEGSAKAIVNGEEHEIAPGDIVTVPAGAEHDFINTGDSALKLFTIYAPPHHPDGTIHETKAEAVAAEASE